MASVGLAKLLRIGVRIYSTVEEALLIKKKVLKLYIPNLVMDLTYFYKKFIK
jgi:hypothetical protein